MRPPFRVETGVADPPPVSRIVPDVYHAALEAEGEWDLSGILPLVEIDVCSSLRLYFTIIRDKCVK